MWQVQARYQVHLPSLTRPRDSIWLIHHQNYPGPDRGHVCPGGSYSGQDSRNRCPNRVFLGHEQYPQLVFRDSGYWVRVW